jgi:hypothetical protein
VPAGEGAETGLPNNQRLITSNNPISA